MSVWLSSYAPTGSLLPEAPGQTFSLPEEQLKAEEEGDVGSAGSSMPAKSGTCQIKRDRQSTDASASEAGNAMKVCHALAVLVAQEVSPLSCSCIWLCWSLLSCWQQQCFRCKMF